MTRAEVLAELRCRLGDRVEPYSWSDTRCMNALSLGQDQFCRDTGFFHDLTSFTIATEASTPSYDLDPAIIEVKEVWIGDVQLNKLGLPALASPTPGMPYGWRADRETGKLTPYPTPDAVYAMKLRVWRKALVPFNHMTTGSNPVYDGALEIPEEFHYAPIEWACWWLLKDHDRELQDPMKAEEHLAQYKAFAREGKRAFQRISSASLDVVPNTLYLV